MAVCKADAKTWHHGTRLLQEPWGTHCLCAADRSQADEWSWSPLDVTNSRVHAVSLMRLTRLIFPCSGAELSEFTVCLPQGAVLKQT